MKPFETGIVYHMATRHHGVTSWRQANSKHRENMKPFEGKHETLIGKT